MAMTFIIWPVCFDGTVLFHTLVEDISTYLRENAKLVLSIAMA